MAKKPIKSNLLLVTCYLLLCGSVGVGFSLKNMKEILRRHTAKPGSVKITVRCLGVTENGNLWHGRFIGLCE
ncbi:MAG: hypothetical protein AAF316_16185 [Cyanobacteria bacterium P01_A01_bin.80]